ncbi:MAG: hypothetical protein H6626_06815 [Pseudobdellovibrionaceae bacterium]|nr:hypothetical protein [Bdellovibrionales bacterium]USN48795.1 MAG: hypothetical protein H6626_06815 [Pseudobdellovibrionaceae bacterium]
MQVKQLQPVHIDHLNHILRVRHRLMEKLGLTMVPPIFQLGDEVIFIYGPRDHHYDRGVIVVEEMNFVTVRTPQGREYSVSPFALIPLPEPQGG